MDNNNQFNKDPEEINEKDFNDREKAISDEEGDKMAGETAEGDPTEDTEEQSEKIGVGIGLFFIFANPFVG